MKTILEVLDQVRRCPAQTLHGHIVQLNVKFAGSPTRCNKGQKNAALGEGHLLDQLLSHL